MLVRLLPWEARIAGSVARSHEKSGRWVCGECTAERVTCRNTQRSALSDRTRRPTGYGQADTIVQQRGYHAAALTTKRKAPSGFQKKRNASVSLTEPDTKLWRASRNGVKRESTEHKKAPRLWRSVSSAASLEDLERMFEQDTESVTAQPAQAPRLPPGTIQMLDKISTALKQGASDWLFKIVSPALLESQSMAAIPEEMFTNMLAIWCSKDYFEDIVDHHLAINETSARSMRATPLEDVVNEYLSVVTNVVHMRRKGGVRLTTAQYEHLLRATHLTGSSTVAQLYWNWMAEDSAPRDVNCCAQYLGAHVWNDMLPAYRERSHLTPFNTVARENPYATKPFDNYKVRIDGIKQFVTEVFGQLTKDRAGTNEELICHVMVGLAREGDVRGMQKLMSRTWGIDVAAIMADDDSAPSRSLTEGSPLQPTDRLLTTLAFCYGINSDLPKALRVIDYVSRHFSLSPSHEVWKLLLNWAYVLSRRRKSTSEFQPVLEPSAVFNIWETMQAPPYSISPSLDMFDKLVRALHASQRAPDMFAVMRAGLDLRKSDIAARATAKEALSSLDNDDKGAIERAQRNYESKHMAVKRGAQYLKTWSRLFLGLTDAVARVPEPGRAAEKVCYEDVPSLLGRRWSAYAGRRMRYFVPTGLVEIEAAREGEVEDLHRRLASQGRKRKEAVDRSVRAVGHDWVVKDFESRRLAEAEV